MNLSIKQSNAMREHKQVTIVTITTTTATTTIQRWTALVTYSTHQLLWASAELLRVSAARQSSHSPLRLRISRTAAAQMQRYTQGPPGYSMETLEGKAPRRFFLCFFFVMKEAPLEKTQVTSAVKRYCRNERKTSTAAFVSKQTKSAEISLFFSLLALSVYRVVFDFRAVSCVPFHI
jgi:hypothetical protein